LLLERTRRLRPCFISCAIGGAPLSVTLGGMCLTYTLDSGLERNRHDPDTFKIPVQMARETLRPGDFAKLMFRITINDEVHVERMWVRVQECNPGFYIGVLDNQPTCAEEICIGMTVDFEADHVIDIQRNAT